MLRRQTGFARTSIPPPLHYPAEGKGTRTGHGAGGLDRDGVACKIDAIAADGSRWAAGPPWDIKRTATRRSGAGAASTAYDRDAGLGAPARTNVARGLAAPACTVRGLRPSQRTRAAAAAAARIRGYASGACFAAERALKWLMRGGADVFEGEDGGATRSSLDGWRAH